MRDSGLTILALPKPFYGHIGIIQRNAITSWTKLKPRPEVYLFGEEPGIAEIAIELGASHLRKIERNDCGTPLLGDLLAKARAKARTGLLCYVNSDIILKQEFLDAVGSVTREFDQFLCVAHRWNVDVTTLIEFDGDWEERFRREVEPNGTGGHASAIDVFVFPPETYKEVPPLTLGRAWFDQWLIKDARIRKIPVVDVTRVARAIHQNHEYTHIEGGQKAAYWGAEAQKNLEIYGEAPHAYTLLSATHELTAEGRIRRVPFRKQKAAMRELLMKTIIAPTASVRKRLGLRRRRAIQEDRAAKA